MAAGNNNLWASVCQVVELPALEADKRYLNPTLRADNQAVLKETLEAIFTKKPTSHWLQAFSEAGVPCSPINNYAQALSDPQVEYMGWVQDLTLANGFKTKTFGSPMLINGKSLKVNRRPPQLGEHTDEVLAQLGLSINKE